MVHRSIEVWCDETPFEQLPTDILDALGPNDEAAYRAGPAYFTQRAALCAYRPMRKFFRMLGKASDLHLHLYGGLLPEYQAYFGFNLSSIGRYVQVRLGPAALPGNPPIGLIRIYQDINGTIDGRELCGGWSSAEEVKSVTDLRWQPVELGGRDPARSYPVYGFGNGDYAGYSDRRRGFEYDHESGGRLEAHDLLDWAAQYFGDYAGTFCL